MLVWWASPSAYLNYTSHPHTPPDQRPGNRPVAVFSFSKRSPIRRSPKPPPQMSISPTQLGQDAVMTDVLAQGRASCYKASILLLLLPGRLSVSAFHWVILTNRRGTPSIPAWRRRRPRSPLRSPLLASSTLPTAKLPAPSSPPSAAPPGYFLISFP